MFGQTFAALLLASAAEAQIYLKVDWDSTDAFCNMVGVQAAAGSPIDWDILIELLDDDYQEETLEIDIITTYNGDWTDDDELDGWDETNMILDDGSGNPPRVVTNDLATGTWDAAAREIRILSVTSTDLDFLAGQARTISTRGSDIYAVLRRPGDGDVLAVGEIREMKERDYDWERDYYMGLESDD